jgi:hypothetical protein
MYRLYPSAFVTSCYDMRYAKAAPVGAIHGGATAGNAA